MFVAHATLPIIGWMISLLLGTAVAMPGLLQKRDEYDYSCQTTSIVEYTTQCPVVPDVEYGTQCYASPVVGSATNCEAVFSTEYTTQCLSTPVPVYPTECYSTPTTEYTTLCHSTADVEYVTQCYSTPTTEYTTQCYSTPASEYITHCETIPTTEYTTQCYSSHMSEYITDCRTTYTTNEVTECYTTSVVESIPCPEYLLGKRDVPYSSSYPGASITPYPPSYPSITPPYAPPYPGVSITPYPEPECDCETTRYTTDCETTCSTQWITPCSTICSTYDNVHCETTSKVDYITPCSTICSTYGDVYCETTSSVHYISECDPTPITAYVPCCETSSTVKYVPECYTKSTVSYIPYCETSSTVISMSTCDTTPTTEYVSQCQTIPTTQYPTACYTEATTQYITSCPALPPPTHTPEPSEGPGVGISCSLVQSASSVFQNTLCLDTTCGDHNSLLSYYAQVLQMACLRSSSHCGIPECSEVNSLPHIIPPGCKEGEDLGGPFEEHVFTELIQGSSFDNFTARKEKVDGVIASLLQQLETREIASPFLNFMLSVGGDQDTESLVQTYYSSVELLEDLNPIFARYIEGQISACGGVAVKDTVLNIGRTHSTLLKCGLGPSFIAQSIPDMNSTYLRKRDDTPKTYNQDSAGIASFFVPVIGAQKRNEEIIKNLEGQEDPSSFVELADDLGAELPVSPDLQDDPKNWIYTQTSGQKKVKRQSGSGKRGNVNSESAALPDEASFVKKEMSDEVGDKITLINQIVDTEGDPEDTFVLDTVRNDEGLSDFVAVAGLFPPTPDGFHTTKPNKISRKTGEYTVVGPVVVIYPANSDLVPGRGIFKRDMEKRQTNGVSAGNGGALEAVPPTDQDIGNVLYKSATIRLRVDPKHYVDADTKIDPAKDLYIIDLVSGDGLESTYIEKEVGGEGGSGYVEAQLEFGRGVWAGGWGGGGSFVVGVKDSA